MNDTINISKKSMNNQMFEKMSVNRPSGRLVSADHPSSKNKKHKKK